MKKSVSLFLLLAFIIAGLYNPSDALCFEETLYLFQTVDDPAVPYDPEVLERAPFWNDNWDAYNPPIFVVPLGASLWAVNTKNKDGMIVRQKVRQIGTGTAVAVITDPAFPEFDGDALAPFYFEADIGTLSFKACGKCIVTNNLITSLGIVLVSCDLAVYPDPSQGIIAGNATSNSIFNFGNPEFQTGSFWTLRLFND